MSADGEAKFVIRLLGPFAALLDGRPLPALRSQKGRWLLALLALRQGQELPRLLLAQTLWPERLQSEALTSLRQILADLRRALGSAADPVLIATPRTLALSASGVDVDTRAFDLGIIKEDADALRRAVATYRGPLLEECGEPWVIAERAQRQRQYLKALDRLAALARAEGSDAEEMEYLRQAIEADPTRETLQGSLLRAFARQGDYGSVTQAYQALRRRLYEEFHVEPSPELQALYRQLQAQAARQAHPAPSCPSSPNGLPSIHIPRPLTPLIGRDAQTNEIMARLSMVRLVTLVGMGGMGKTRLAIHVALQVAENYTDGVWFVDLSALTAPHLVVQQVGLALCVPEQRGRTRLETLIDFLQARQLLLILDNCEPLLAACAELAAALLSSCPGLRMLTTSRQKLGLMGESLCHLEGLTLPAMAEELDAEALLRSEAGQLFVERARALRADMPLTGQSAVAIASLCTLLNGLPLAIELAAALVETLTPQEILMRLEAGLELPAEGCSARPQRHQTLETLMEGSFHLLTLEEQTLLRRLAVFAGGWTLPDAEAVCAHDTDSACDLLPSLSRLVAKSFVVAEAWAGKTHYRMLEVIRRFAERRLEQSGELNAARERHRDHYLGLCEEAERRLTGPEQTLWLEFLDAAHDNLRAALRTAEAAEDNRMLMLRLVNALGRFWQIRCCWSEGRIWIERALSRPEIQEDRALRANALNWAAILATYQGEFSRGRADAEEGLALWTALEDTRGIASSLGCLGIVAGHRGDYETARSYHTTSLELARANQDESGMAGALGYLGNIATAQGDFALAWLYYMESLTLRRALKDTWGVAASLNNLGLLAHHEQDGVAAARFFAESLALRRKLGDRRCLAITLNLLGLCACEQGEADLGRDYLTEGLDLCREIGDKRSIAYSLEAFAALAILEAHPDRAATLSGAAAALREAIASPLPPSEQPVEQAKLQALHHALGADAFAQHWRTGYALTFEAAVGYIHAEPGEIAS